MRLVADFFLTGSRGGSVHAFGGFEVVFTDFAGFAICFELAADQDTIGFRTQWFRLSERKCRRQFPRLPNYSLPLPRVSEIVLAGTQDRSCSIRSMTQQAYFKIRTGSIPEISLKNQPQLAYIRIVLRCISRKAQRSNLFI